MIPYCDFATHATEEGETPLPLPTISSTSRLKLVNLTSYSTIEIDKNNKKRKRESSLK